MTRIKVIPGDVFQIPLPDGRFAYGRVYDDAAIGVYSTITDKPFEPPIGSRTFFFIVGLYSDLLEKGHWRIVGRDPFGSDESPWPPPNFVRDVISGEYQIYYKGELRPAEPREVQGLEEAAVYDSHHIVERIVREMSKR